MRTTVPLIRKLDPDQTGPIDLQFDVPAWADDDAPPLFIGVRVTGNDPTAVADVVDGLRRADISAKVHLYRLQESNQAAVALERVQWLEPTQVEFLSLGPDGAVPGLTATNADVISMQTAGLISPSTVYRELKFAGASNVPAGRYRAVIRLDKNHKALFAVNAELLIAYAHKSK